MTALAAGFRVIVPNLRGYGKSDKPTDVESYALPFLAADVLAVMADAGVEQAHVVGHDWGAAIASGLGAIAGDRVDHLVALSVGHPSTFLTSGFEQHEKSWYMLFFEHPGIAERWLSDDGWANFRARVTIPMPTRSPTLPFRHDKTCFLLAWLVLTL